MAVDEKASTDRKLAHERAAHLQRLRAKDVPLTADELIEAAHAFAPQPDGIGNRLLTEVLRLQDLMAANYWDKVRAENTELHEKAKRLAAELAKVKLDAGRGSGLAAEVAALRSQNDYLREEIAVRHAALDGAKQDNIILREHATRLDGIASCLRRSLEQAHRIRTGDPPDNCVSYLVLATELGGQPVRWCIDNWTGTRWESNGSAVAGWMELPPLPA